MVDRQPSRLTLIDGQIALVQLQDNAVDGRRVNRTDLSVRPAASAADLFQKFFLDRTTVFVPAVAALSVHYLSVIKVHVMPVTGTGLQRSAGLPDFFVAERTHVFCLRLHIRSC